MTDFTSPPPLTRAAIAVRIGIIAAVVVVTATAFAAAGGWLSPNALTPASIVDALQRNAGVFPGARRNHAKGVCVSGYFEGNGAASDYSVADVFRAQRTPLVGRLAIPGGNPAAPDNATPVRSMALRLTQANGQQWRTGMNNMPVFLVATPQAFYDQLTAAQPDPATGKPDPAKLKAFFAAHAESAAFLAWAGATKPSASYVSETYESLNAFNLVDAAGQLHPARWRVTPADATGEAKVATGSNDLDEDLQTRLAAGPLRWHLLVTLANPGDSTKDSTQRWPADRKTIDAGTVVFEHSQPQANGECRDINYDPTILPNGIAISDDPLLPARSAAYADSYLRRTSEEAHFPGSASAKTEVAK